MIEIRVEHKGSSGWSIRPPKIDGHVCRFVARFGGSHTIFTYRPKGA